MRIAQLLAVAGRADQVDRADLIRRRRRWVEGSQTELTAQLLLVEGEPREEAQPPAEAAMGTLHGDDNVLRVDVRAVGGIGDALGNGRLRRRLRDDLPAPLLRPEKPCRREVHVRGDRACDDAWRRRRVGVRCNGLRQP